MDDERWVAGMPRLDRQDVPRGRDGRRLTPSRVPETRPTPLQDAFIYLSVVVLFCGVIAISALELGTPASSLVVKVPVVIGGAILVAVTADAIVRVWRSAWAWLPVDRGRGTFRFVWVASLVAVLIATLAAIAVVATAG